MGQWRNSSRNLPGEGIATSTPKVLQNVTLPWNVKLSSNWKRFERAWKSYEVACRVKEEQPKIRAATLNVEGLAFEHEGDRVDADKMIAVLRKYCLGEANETYERSNFFTRDHVRKLMIMSLLKARLHRGFLLRSFSFWCMRLNGLTYECTRPSVQR